MKFVYIANHGCHGNDDEGSITYALEKLGHTVNCIPESEGIKARKARGDVLLFHKWFDPGTLFRLNNRIIRCFWYFDLVNYNDPSLVTRCHTRKRWMRDITPNVDIGFCTDGDWVEQDTSGKLFKLTQGADERILSDTDDIYQIPKNPIKLLFTGIGRGGGTEREAFVIMMREKYGCGATGFYHVEKGMYREYLAALIRRASIVVAPPSPVSHNYYSNRVYNTLGFGGFLLHPYSKSLLSQYQDGKEVAMYSSLSDLFRQIDYYLPLGITRRDIAAAGLRRTRQEHTYTYRCKIMCEKLEELVKQQRERNV